MSEYDIEKNYHAHFEMMGLDSTGQAIKRNKLSKFQLSKMQTDVAKILEMERGVLGSKAKRRDTHDFKERGSEQQKQKQTVATLKAEIETLRKEMASAKQYTKADYQALNKLKKSVKKATLEDAVEEFFLFKKRIEKEKEDLKKEIYHPKYVNLKTKEPLKNSTLVRHFEKENTKLKNELKNSSNQINEMKEKIKENTTLKEKIEEQKELIEVAVESQDTFREMAQNYQAKYLAEQKKVKHIENPINTELQNKIKELEKEVYSPKYITPDTKKPMKNSAMVAILERENAELKSYISSMHEKNITVEDKGMDDFTKRLKEIGATPTTDAENAILEQALKEADAKINGDKIKNNLTL